MTRLIKGVSIQHYFCPVLKNMVTILFLLAFTAHTFDRAVIWMDYYLNTASFEKNCENKARPAMKCHGKCQAMKQIKNEEKKEQQNPDRKLTRQNEVISSKSFFTTYSAKLFSPGIKENEYPAFSLPAAVPVDIFHPPSA